jgi:hypothetical protein
MTRRRTLFAVLLLLLPMLGCGGAQEEAKRREESRLKPLAIFYGQFLGQHRGQPPASETEFREFIRSQGAEALKTFAVPDVETLFVSERDQKPYVIAYGDASKGAPIGPAGSPVVAYEQVGAAGKRFVASAMGAVEEVDEVRFKELVPTATLRP